jgi:hypothetical protein
MDINTENIFKTKCSTKTLVLKPKYYEENIILPNSYKNKLRNCFIKKIEKKCVKLYLNGTIQINGIPDIRCLSDVIKKSEINRLSNHYSVECILNNWTLCFEKKEKMFVDLTKTMFKLNENNIIAYFQRGYPLIIKINKLLPVRKYNYINDNLELIDNGEKNVKITLMLFKSSKCICTIGGDIYSLPLEVFEKIQKNIIYTEYLSLFQEM